MTTIHHVRRRLAHTAAPARLASLGRDEFEGYASLFGVADGAGDVVAPGAFARSLRERPPARVRLLYQHFAQEPIGVWEEIKEDVRGLYVHGRLIGDVQRAREVMELIRERALDGLSIGFRTRRARRDPASGHRILLDVELWEISIVTFPLLPQSRVTSVGAKGDELFASLQRMSASLRTRRNAVVIPGEHSRQRRECEERGPRSFRRRAARTPGFPSPRGPRPPGRE